MAHDVLALILNILLPLPAANSILSIFSVSTSAAPFCVTFTVLSPASDFTVIVAVRSVIEVFSSTLTVTLPPLLPDVGLTLHQAWSLDTVHEVFEVILIDLDPLLDANSILLVSIDISGFAADWDTSTFLVNSPDLIVRVAVRDPVVEFSVAVKVT